MPPLVQTGYQLSSLLYVGGNILKDMLRAWLLSCSSDDELACIC